ncbi:MAG: sigma-70 family RNA polymerase sigma factor [Dehalococcoidia bacterium]|nr:sigma-70 family RNA polymerase sigma factor [Dehalococcoidia bacterium]
MNPADVDKAAGEADSDEVLVERAKADLEAFGSLYERYVGPIYSYIYHRTGMVADSEDLTERVFMQALTHLGGYSYRGMPFSAWLYRIAHNSLANWYRDRARHKSVSLDDAVLGAEDGGNELDQVEAVALVRRAVGALAPERQQILLLKFVEDLPHAEIGKIMGRTEGAVKALLFRTLRSLKEELGENIHETLQKQQKRDGRVD